MSGFEINTITLSGNLTRDPELRQTSGGTSVCGLRIANNTRKKVSGEWEDYANYFNVTIWSRIGELVAEDLSKGDRIVVTGRMEWREYEDREGVKRQVYDVVAESIVTIPKGGGGGGRRRQESDVPADDDFSRPGGDGDFTAEPAAQGPDDDIPF